MLPEAETWRESNGTRLKINLSLNPKSEGIPKFRSLTQSLGPSVPGTVARPTPPHVSAFGFRGFGLRISGSLRGIPPYGPSNRKNCRDADLGMSMEIKPPLVDRVCEAKAQLLAGKFVVVCS